MAVLAESPARPVMPRHLIDAALLVATVAGVPAVTAALGDALTLTGTVPLVAWLGGVLLARRRWPVGVLLASTVAIVALQTAGLTDAGWIWPSTAAYASAVLYGRLSWAVGVGALTVWVAAAWEWSVDGRSADAVAASVGIEALWLVAVLAATTAYRNWRRWQQEVVGRLEQNMRERELDDARRQAEERLRVAREVHDVVAHTLTVVGVQMRVAADALDTAPDEARAAIETAQAVRREAITDLRGLVTVLRAAGPDEPQQSTAAVDAPALAPVARIVDLPRIVAAVSSDDLRTELAETGEPRSLPGPTDVALTRVVQESLTNVVRHAAATTARVEVHYGQSRVAVTVTDNGRGGPPGGRDGHGLAGLRERVTALGGTFSAGPATAGGFAVHAAVPDESAPPASPAVPDDSAPPASPEFPVPAP